MSKKKFTNIEKKLCPCCNSDKTKYLGMRGGKFQREGLGIESKIVKNIFDYVWLKAVINSSINPVAAHNKVVNGKLNVPELNEQVEKICNESSLIAQKIGINLPLDPWKEIRNIIRNTSDLSLIHI